MKLHAANLAIAVGAEGEEVQLVQERLQHMINNQEKVSMDDALRFLNLIRGENVI